MAVFKQIGGGNHTVEPFEVNYSQSFAWISGSTSLSGFSINLVDEPPTNYPISTTQSLGGVTDGILVQIIPEMALNQIHLKLN